MFFVIKCALLKTSFVTLSENVYFYNIIIHTVILINLLRTVAL